MFGRELGALPGLGGQPFVTVKLASLCFVLVALFFPATAFSLPWDIDMYRQQSLKANEIARSPVEGTVPLGYRPFRMSIEEADKKLKNPIKMSTNSVWRGQRLWNANCLTCHGKSGDGKGPVGSQMGVPNVLLDNYKNSGDGKVYAILHYGLRAMPRYGYKLSPVERWDVINYLRFLQGTDVDGLERPEP